VQLLINWNIKEKNSFHRSHAYEIIHVRNENVLNDFNDKTFKIIKWILPLAANSTMNRYFFKIQNIFEIFFEDFLTEKIFEFENTVKKIRLILIYRMFRHFKSMI